MKKIKISGLKNRINALLDNKTSINPFRESLIVVLLYSIFGFTWIIVTDSILNYFIKDSELNAEIQTAKGWLFIILTVIILFWLVNSRMKLIKDFIDQLFATSSVLTQTEEQLQIQKALTEKIIGQAPVMIVIWDKEGNLKSISPYALEVLGYDDYKALTRDWINLVLSDINAEGMRNVFRKLKSKQRLFNIETELTKKDGTKVNVLWNSGILPEQNNQITEYVSFGIDITEKRITEERLKFMAFHDTLTELPNRESLENYVNHSFEEEHYQFALLYIDVDNFKYINDTLGHNVGDELLKHIGKCLLKTIQEPHFAARLGGDEFAIVLKNYNNPKGIVDAVETVKNAIGKTWFIYNHNFFITLSIGVAIAKDNGFDFTTLSKNADIAMYNAKKEGKNRMIFFDEAIENDNFLHIDLAKKIQRAIENKEFELYYQPQYILSDKTIFGFEALIRWHDAKTGFISPAEFIPLAEETLQIYDIEKWVFTEAIKQKRKWDEEGNGHFSISINLSSKSLISDVNFAWIESTLANYDGDLSKIIVEVTETAIISDTNKVVNHAQRLKNLGVKIALDDFGTGYSSLTHIKLFPIDIVKLDRSFVNQIENKGKDEMIVNSVIYLVKKLGYKLVAEGIEHDSQLNYLIENECDFGQGYLLAHPQNIQKIDQLIKEKTE